MSGHIGRLRRAHGKKWAPRSGRPELLRNSVEQLLASLDPDGVQARLCQLWQHWEMVLGPDLAPLAMPLGHHGDVLLVAACDNMVMQELQLQTEEILERVNAFTDGLFRSVRISLPLDRRVIAIGEGLGAEPVPGGLQDAGDGDSNPQRPSGIYLAQMDMDSPVARCYARFAGKSGPVGTKEKKRLDRTDAYRYCAFVIPQQGGERS